MDGEFHEASVMGHDILGLSSGLDSVLSLLGLDTCNESIYSSGLGLEDVHHEGSVIDFSLVDSSRTGFEEDLEIAPITLDGLIPLLASHQCPTPPHSSGNARVKTRTGDYVTFDSQVASSVEESGLITNFLNDAVVSTSLSDTQLAFFNNVTTPLTGHQGKSATNLYTEASDCITSSLNDVISSTSLSTTPLACLSEDRMLSKGHQGKANTSFNSEGAILLDAPGNVSSSLNDTIVSTNQSTNQLTSKRVGSPSRGPLPKPNASLESEASGTVTSSLNDAVFSTSSSTHPLTSLNKVRTPSIDHQGKANASFKSEGAIFIEAAGNVRNFLNNVIISTSLSNTPLPSLKRDSTPSKTLKEKGVVLEKSKTCAPRGSLSHTHVSKTSKRKQSSAKAVSSTTSGLKGIRTPPQKEQKHFKCSTCGAVYKSHALCVNHVLDRHKPGMRVKHQVSGTLSRNTPSIHLKQPVKISRVIPHGKSSSCASSEDSSILTRQMKMAESDIDLKNNLAPNGKFGKNRETSTDRKCGPTQLESKCLAGSKRKRSKSPRSCKGTPKVNPRSCKKSLESAFIDSSEFTSKDVGSQVMEDESDVSDMTSVQDPKQSLTSTASKKKGVTYKEKRNNVGKIKGTESHTSSSKRVPEPFKEVARKKRKLEPVSIERVAHLLDPRSRRQMKMAESDNDSRNDPSPDRKFGKILEKDTDLKCGSISCRRIPSTGENKCLVGSKRKRSNSPRSRISAPKVNPRSWKESQERALIDSSEFACEDIHVGRQETKSSNVTMVQDLKQSSTSSASKEKHLAHTEKRDNRGRPNETENHKCSSERDPWYHKEVAEKRTKEVSGSSERMVYLLDPRQLTIVICPQCQKAFTTYMGYSLHAAQVHNISANDAPGKLMQLLVQRSPQYCSKNTPDQGLDEPQENGLCRKGGICREMVGKSVCTSSDAFSSTVKKHMSDQSQLAVKTAQTETSDSLGAIFNDSSEGILCAKSTQTDISFLGEPFCDQRKENRESSSCRIWQIDDLRTDVHGGSSRTSLEKNAGTNQKVVPVTSSNLFDLQPSDINHEQSVKMRSKTSQAQMKETSTMIKHGGSLLCECCGVILQDLSGLDDNHKLGSVPGELECKWTAGVKAMEESSFLCSMCGIHISSLTDLSSHSASCGVVLQDSSGVDDNDQIVSAPGDLMRRLTAQEEASTGNNFFCSVCKISIPSHRDFRSHSCDMAMSAGVQRGMSASPSSKPRMDVGDQGRLCSSLMCIVSKGDLPKDKTRLKEYQGLFNGFPGVIKGDQPLDRRVTLKRINAGTDRSVIRKQSGSVSHTMVKIPQEFKTPGNPGHVSLDHMLEQCPGLLNESTGVIEAENPEDRWNTLKRMNVEAAKRLNIGRSKNSSHATGKIPQGMENSYDVSLDSMLEQCQRMLKESADVLGDGSI